MTRSFYLGFKDAMLHGIDYRDYRKVRELPEGRTLTAVAGIWGDYSDMRILFVDPDNDERICRTVFAGTDYYVPEIDRKGRDIAIDEKFQT